MTDTDPSSPEFEALSKEEKAKIYYFDLGWDVSSIADELDERQKTISDWLDDIKPRPKNELRRNRPRWVGPEFKKVFALYEAGKLPSEIVKEVSLHRATVYKVLAEKYGARFGRPGRKSTPRGLEAINMREAV